MPMFNGLKDSKITGDPNFTVTGEGTMFGDSENLTIDGGSFSAKESDSGGMRTFSTRFSCSQPN